MNKRQGNWLNLKVGDKIKIGKEYKNKHDYWNRFKIGQIIKLIKGSFEYDNGLYTVNQTAPSIYNKENFYTSAYLFLFILMFYKYLSAQRALSN